MRFARLILKFKPDISPNKLTIFSTLTGVFSGVFFALGYPLLGGVFSQLANIMDGLDGDVARLTGRTSRLGSFLDAVTDRVADSSIIIGATIYLVLAYQGLNLIIPLLIGTIMLASSMLVSYSRLRAEYDLGIIFKTGASGLLANRDVRLFVIMIGGVLEQFLKYSLLLTLAILSIACILTVASRIYVAVKTGENVKLY